MRCRGKDRGFRKKQLIKKGGKRTARRYNAPSFIIFKLNRAF